MRYTMTFLESAYDELLTHLWADRSVERAAYLLCRVVRSSNEVRLLVRSVWPVLPEDVEEASDAHMKIAARSFRRAMKLADQRGESFVFVHSHPESVPFHSVQDDRTERPLFTTAYNRIHHDVIHASLVISARSRPVGRVWLRDGSLAPIDLIRVIGRRFRFYSESEAELSIPDFFDRQVRAFGKDIQLLLRRLTIGVVGVGGTGSAVVQQLARLAVGRLLLADGEKFEGSNVNRVYGSRAVDQDVDKVKVAERAVAEIGIGTEVRVLPKPISFESVLREFRECDVIFGCTDEEWGRSLLTRFAIYYAVPVFDMGVKIRSENGLVESIQGRVTTLMASKACLFCRNRITAERVRAESLRVLNPDAYHALLEEGYVPELGDTAPAVIPFTSAIASAAVNELLHRLTGYLGEDRTSSEILHLFSADRVRTNDRVPDENCTCGDPYYINRGDSALFLDTTWRSE